jgi:hypothetical protein
MKPDEILIAKTAPGFTPEPQWWRFCVKADGHFEYEKSRWSGKDGENTKNTTGMLNNNELARIKKIITTLDDVELDGLIVEDAGSSTIDYRRADETTGSVEQHGEPIDDDAEKDVFDTAWISITKIMADHIE